jgi:hypothetical protein
MRRFSACLKASQRPKNLAEYPEKIGMACVLPGYAGTISRSER